MVLTKVKRAGAAMLISGLTLTGAAVMAHQNVGQQQPSGPPAARDSASDSAQVKPTISPGAALDSSQEKAGQEAASAPAGPRRADKETGPAGGRSQDSYSRRILAKLEDRIAMSFKEETPLEVVPQYLKDVTKSPGLPQQVHLGCLRIAADSDERRHEASLRLAVGVRHHPDHGPNDRRPLVDAIRPTGDKVTLVVIDPGLTVLDRTGSGTDALEPKGKRVAVAGGSSELQIVGTKRELSAQLAKRRLFENQVRRGKLQVIERLVDIGVVQQAAISPSPHDRVDYILG
jgi:hypothetical protein